MTVDDLLQMVWPKTMVAICYYDPKKEERVRDELIAIEAQLGYGEREVECFDAGHIYDETTRKTIDAIVIELA